MTELVGLLLVLVLLGGIGRLLLGPSSSGAKERRRLLVDGRRRDRDPLGPSLLIPIALVDLSSFGDAARAGTTFVLGAAMALLFAFRALQPPIYLTVGGAALVKSLVEVGLGDRCGSALAGGERAGVLVGLSVFLLAVGGFRLVFAPLPASGAQGRGAFLALYGVVAGAVYVAHLERLGGLSAWSLGAWAIGLACLVALALGIAVQPVFAATAIGVGVVVLALVTESAAGCLETASLVAALLGFFLTLPALTAAGRRLGLR